MSRASRKADREQARRRPGWLCDGHGNWISPAGDLMAASEARKLGAPVPIGQADPAPFPPADPGSECPF